MFLLFFSHREKNSSDQILITGDQCMHVWFFTSSPCSIWNYPGTSIVLFSQIKILQRLWPPMTQLHNTTNEHVFLWHNNDNNERVKLLSKNTLRWNLYESYMNRIWSNDQKSGFLAEKNMSLSFSKKHGNKLVFISQRNVFSNPALFSEFVKGI